ncbi:RHS repeat-associated core domain-containing protein [Agaribacterium sp. ZY112]|uniref:RHS repeat-associated core domain-containing protein n=1 Tax=Agaribacterium sp. ZY112 TaxID=3233574 RepID=UPI0035244731
MRRSLLSILSFLLLTFISVNALSFTPPKQTPPNKPVAPPNDADGNYTVSWDDRVINPVLYERFNGGTWTSVSTMSQGGSNPYGAVNKPDGIYEYRSQGYNTSSWPPVTNYSDIARVVVAQPNQAPTISSFSPVNIGEGKATGRINFTVSDTQTPADSLSVDYKAISTVAQLGNVVLGGSGSNRYVEFFSLVDEVGVAEIEIAVSDENGAKSISTLNVTVTALPNEPSITINGNIPLEENNSGNIHLTIEDKYGPENLDLSLLVSDETSNLISAYEFEKSPFGGVFLLKVTPSKNASGLIDATIVARNPKGFSSTKDLEITIREGNDAPHVEPIAPVRHQHGAGYGYLGMTFEFHDEETPVEDLDFTLTSSNPSVVRIGVQPPEAEGDNWRLLTLGDVGVSTLTVSVSDGVNEASTQTFTFEIFEGAPPVLNQIGPQTIARNSVKAPVVLDIVAGTTPVEDLHIEASVDGMSEQLIPRGGFSSGVVDGKKVLFISPHKYTVGSARINVKVRGLVYTVTGSFDLEVKPLPLLTPTLAAPSSVTTNTVPLHWTRSQGAEYYELDQSKNSGAWSFVQRITGDLDKVDLKVSNSASYSYRLRACQTQNICSQWSDTVSTSVSFNSNSPIDPTFSTLSPELSPAPSLASMSHIDESYRASDALDITPSGGVSYNYPILVAPGTAGVAPELSIAMASSGGAGMLGRGANISGLSSISRCRQTALTDGQFKPITWGSSDRFCFNGQRLLVVSGNYGTPGSVYKTEIDSYVTITAIGGSSGHPDYFELRAKDGSVSKFGGTGSHPSELRPLTSSGTAPDVLSWHLSTFKDSVGNAIDYVYTDDSNAKNFRIQGVIYAYGNRNSGGSSDLGGTVASGAYIEFDAQENRHAYRKSYVAGRSIEYTKVIYKISSYAAPVNQSMDMGSTRLLREYSFSYDGAWIDAICESASNISSCTQANARKTFDWRTINNIGPGSSSWVDSTSNASITLASGVSQAPEFTLLDIDGNSISDVVWSERDGAYDKIYYALSSSSGIGEKTYLARFNAASGNDKTNMVPVDVNLDGRTDLAVKSGDDWRLFLAKPDESNLGSWGLSGVANQYEFPFSGEVALADFDGDGFLNAMSTERMWELEAGVGSIESAHYYGFVEQSDYPSRSGSDYRYTLTNGEERIWKVKKLRPIGDLNGDGLVDVITLEALFRVSTDHSGRETLTDLDYQRVQLATYSENNFDLFSVLESASSDEFDELEQFYNSVQGIDVNTDGNTDIIYNHGPMDGLSSTENLWILKRSDGVRLMTGQEAFIPGDEPLQAPSFSDLNDDGVLDIIWRNDALNQMKVSLWNSQSKNYQYYSTFAHSVGNFDASKMYLPSDVDGDAWLDLVVFDASSNRIDFYPSFRAGEAKIGSLVQLDSINGGGEIYSSTKLSWDTLGRSSQYRRLDIAANVVSNDAYQRCVDQLYASNIFNQEIIDNMCSSTSGDHHDYDTAGFYSDLYDPFSNYGYGYGDVFKTLITDHGPILEVAGSYPVVTSIKSTAPYYQQNSNENEIRYVYHQARVQAGGRGWLGFKKVEKVNLQTETVTSTDYRQDWPFIGQPSRVKSQLLKGGLIDDSSFTYRVHNVDEGQAGLSRDGNDYIQLPSSYRSTKDLGPLRVYVSNSSVANFDLDGDGSSSGSKLVTDETETEIDTWGNVTKLVSTTKIGHVKSTLASVTTQNHYLADYEHLGRLSWSEVDKYRSDASSQNDSTKRVEFQYYGMGCTVADTSINTSLTGMLCEEKIIGDNRTLTTHHYYDDFGNPAFTKTTDSVSSEFRLSAFTKYTLSGRFPEKTYTAFPSGATGSNASNNSGVFAAFQIEAQAQDAEIRLVGEVEQRNKYGAALRSSSYVGGSAVTATAAYTDLGIKYYEADSTGAWVLTETSLETSSCVGYGQVITDASGARSRKCFDALGRVITSAKNNYSVVRSTVVTRYDKQGRAYKVSEPFRSGFNDEKYWTETTDYDAFGRPLHVELPYSDVGEDGGELGVAATVSTVYSGFTTTYINPLGQRREERKNGLGDLVWVRDEDGSTVSYEYLASGKLHKIKHPDSSIETIIFYDEFGNKTSMSDPDTGDWSYTYNTFGDLICQVDAEGQVLRNTYDILGRKTASYYFHSGTCNNSLNNANSANYFTYDLKANGLGKLAYESKSDGFQRDYSYDSLGRSSEVSTFIPASTDVAAETHYSKTLYDELGRVKVSYDAARQGRDYSHGAVLNHYNEYGYLYKTTNLDGSEVYYEVHAVNVRGQVTQSTLGHNVSLSREYDGSSGRIRFMNTDAGLAPITVQDMEMRWDAVGNLLKRYDKGLEFDGLYRDIEESYAYDDINQLTSSSYRGVIGEYSVNNQQNLSYDPSGLGNISYKSDVGDYSYSGCNAGVHAVCSVTKNGQVTSYSYDQNGRMTSGDGRDLGYTLAGKVASVSKNGHETHFDYDSSNRRYRRVDIDADNNLTTTVYLGSVEKIYREGGLRQWKRSLPGGVLITMDYNGQAYQGSRLVYLIKDHLGSTTAILDEFGSLLQTMSFDSWGARRDTMTWQRMLQNDVERSYITRAEPISNRGFTGHEMLDEVGIIHMNGRTYDAKLARFMQADPFVQAPTLAGSLNRYSYVMNNPLNAIDPSGFNWVSDRWHAAKDEVKTVATVIVVAYLTVVTAGAAGAWAVSMGALKGGFIAGMVAGAAGGFVSGVSMAALSGANSADALRAGFKGAATGALFGGIGGAFNQLGQTGSLGHIAAHGVGGGVLSELQGGEFRTGMMVGVFTKFMSSNVISKVGGEGFSSILGRTAIASAVGGTVSQATGGKFANGAKTAAYAHFFNQESGDVYKFTSDRLKRSVSYAIGRTEAVATFDGETNGIVIKNEKRGGLYKMSSTQTDIPEGYEVRSISTKINFFGGSYDTRATIENAQALVVTESKYSTPKNWSWLAAREEVPVFTTKIGGRGVTVWEPDGAVMPVEFK